MRALSARPFQWGLLAVAITAMSAGDANAFSRGKSGSYGGYGSAGSYGGYAASYGSAGSYGGYAVSYGSAGSYGGYSASYGSAGSYGRPGLFARWHARKAARKAARASYGSAGSYGGYAVSYGGSCGSAGSYGGSYGSAGSSGSYGGYSMPSYSAPANSAPVDAEGATTTDDAAARSAAIFAKVPADAKIYVNGKLTTSTGAERNFVSNGLEPDQTYSYRVRIEYQQDGAVRVEDRVVRLAAGGEARLTVGDGETEMVASQPAQTELKVTVPAEAKVFLAGSPTQQTGQDRVYVSSQLQPGQEWNGYTVRVELQRDGQTLVKEQTLDIAGGQQYELAFDFEDPTHQLASVH